MPALTTVARAFATVNLVIGILGFAGPAVTGNRDRLINIRPGWLLGFVAINWLHALLHLLYGAAGLMTIHTPHAALRYMRLDAVAFATLTAIGLLTVRGRPGIYTMMGMAIDRRGNMIHLIWTALGVLYGSRSSRGT